MQGSHYCHVTSLPERRISKFSSFFHRQKNPIDTGLFTEKYETHRRLWQLAEYCKSLEWNITMQLHFVTFFIWGKSFLWVFILCVFFFFFFSHSVRDLCNRLLLHNHIRYYATSSSLANCQQNNLYLLYLFFSIIEPLLHSLKYTDILCFSQCANYYDIRTARTCQRRKYVKSMCLKMLLFFWGGGGIVHLDYWELPGCSLRSPW